MFEAVELGIKQANVLVHKYEMPCGKVPVLLTAWHLGVFGSVKSEIQH